MPSRCVTVEVHSQFGPCSLLTLTVRCTRRFYTRRVATQRDFGSLLREQRLRAGLSQEKLAYRASLSPQAISLLERGVRRHPRRQTIDALADALDLTVEDREVLLHTARRQSAAAQGHLAQLPEVVPSFTGREDDLHAVLAAASSAPANKISVSITAIDGMAGSGKTALAVKAAHELAPQFVDGQLFLDLHGFTEGLPPDDPFDTLGSALRSLGLPGQAIPETLDERSALYRTALAGRRILVVLDNAAAPEQVFPLLPGMAGAAVIITSRVKLLGIPGAHPISISPLQTQDAKLLLTELMGASDDAVLDEVAERCAGLPLAIEIFAAQAAQGRRSLHELAASLADQNAWLTDPEDRSSLASVFQLSYRPLDAGHQRVLRLMSLNPGSTMDEYAAAAVAGLPIDAIRNILDDLVDHHLLTEPEPAIYTFHDLIRSFAFREAAMRESERDAAARAFHVHYLGMASRAMDLIYHAEANRRPPLARAAAFASALTSKHAAEVWLDRETDTLLRVAESSDELAMHVIGTVIRHLQTRGRWRDAESLLPSALRAAERTSRTEEARALLNAGLVQQIRGSLQQAAELYTRALELSRSDAWPVGEIAATNGHGEVERIAGHHSAAGDHYRSALRLADEIGDRAGQLRALLGLGDTQCALGQFDAALTSYQDCLSISREIGDDFNAVSAQVGLGDIDYDLGRIDDSIVHYEDALVTADRLGPGPARHYALASLASAYQKAGRQGEAMRHMTECLEYSQLIGDRITEITDLLNLADSELALDRLDAARSRIARALAYSKEMNDEECLGRAYRSRGRLLRAEGQFDPAVADLRQAAYFAQRTEMPLAEARAHLDIADCMIVLARPAEAAQHLESAIPLYRQTGSPELQDALAMRTQLISPE